MISPKSWLFSRTSGVIIIINREMWWVEKRRIEIKRKQGEIVSICLYSFEMCFYTNTFYSPAKSALTYFHPCQRSREGMKLYIFLFVCKYISCYLWNKHLDYSLLLFSSIWKLILRCIIIQGKNTKERGKFWSWYKVTLLIGIWKKNVVWL